MVNGPEFIVGEVSRNWAMDGKAQGPLLAESFEWMLAVNLARGYRLHSFDVSQVVTSPGVLNETLVAVFRREDA